MVIGHSQIEIKKVKVVRKCLLVGLAIMVLVTLLGAVGCGKVSIPGRYVNQDNSSVE